MSTNGTEQRETYRFAADIIVFHDTDVLLVERGKEPFRNCKVIPGGHVDADETSRTAAARELTEETGLVIDPARLCLVGIYDEPDRDPRARVVSAVYAVRLTELPGPVKGGDDATAAAWFDIEESLREPLGFDHHRILADAYDALLDERI